MKPDKNYKKLIVLLSVVVLVAIFVFFILISRSNTIDERPHEGTSEDYTSQVVMFDNEQSRELFKIVGGDVRFDSIRSDLYYFAQKEFGDSYKNKEYVGFKITSKLAQNSEKYTLEGRFGAVNNKIIVSFKNLPNTRINVEISDKKTGKRLYEQLPSNSKRNQLIAKLPINNKQYYIDFDGPKNTFTINIYRGGAKERDLALQYLSSELGIDSLKGEKYSVIRTSEGGIFSPNPIVDNKAGDFYE